MGLMKFFFLLPSRAKFLDGFAQNEQLKSQADKVWGQLDGLSPMLLIIAVVLGLVLASFYYTGYNELPGRHYKISHWGVWAFIATLFALLVTAVIEYLGIKTNIRSGLASLFWLCAINNALYCFVVYFLTSAVWCNFLRTNAYKFLKI